MSLKFVDLVCCRNDHWSGLVVSKGPSHAYMDLEKRLHPRQCVVLPHHRRVLRAPHCARAGQRMAKKAIELYIGVSPSQAAMLRSDGIMRVRWLGKSIPCKRSLLTACEAYQEHHNGEGTPPFAAGLIISPPLFAGLVVDGDLEQRLPAEVTAGCMDRDFQSYFSLYLH